MEPGAAFAVLAGPLVEVRSRPLPPGGPGRGTHRRWSGLGWSGSNRRGREPGPSAATDGAPLHFGINCAHPDHFTDAGRADHAAIGRIGLLRANASRSSHAELDEAEALDDGDPVELARQYGDLIRDHPQLQILGGCCGTDARHVEAIAHTCIPRR